MTTTFEASELFWEPGYWPKVVTQDGRTFFRASRKLDADGDVVYVRYQHVSGDAVLVYND